MIYCLDPTAFPDDQQAIETLSYLDENDFQWKIARVTNGFFVKYFGNDYFRESTFEVQGYDGLYYRIKNTNCIFFKDSSFDTFVLMRDILKEGYTDGIWEAIEEFLEERFQHDLGLLESELTQTLD